jgi:hypothetical protein
MRYPENTNPADDGGHVGRRRSTEAAAEPDVGPATVGEARRRSRSDG